MSAIKIVSFDLEGTLTTLDFSKAVWYEGIPFLYSERNNVTFDQARAIIYNCYQEVGDKKLEWYDIKYWSNLFNLDGYQEILNKYTDRVSLYPDVIPTLSALEKEYKLIIATNSTREFLPYLLHGIHKYFFKVISAVSDYSLLKSPQFYLKLSHDLGVRVDEIVHIGDSQEFDFNAAQSVGIKAFYLNRSQKSSTFSSLSGLEDLSAKLLKA